MADGALMDRSDLTDHWKNDLYSAMEEIAREAQNLSEPKKQILIDAIKTGSTTDLWKVF